MGSWQQREPPRRRALAGQVAGAGLAGAAVGAAVAVIWRAGAAAAGSACRPPAQGGSPGFCLPVLQFAVTALSIILVICLGVLAAAVLLRLRPRRITVPVGCTVVAWADFFTAAGFPGGRGPAPWAAAVAAGAGLAALALAAGAGLAPGAAAARRAGLAALAVVVLASLAAPRTIARQEEADARTRQLAALGFPLELPSVPGYHPFDAFPSAGGALVVDMAPDSASASPIAFTVTIAPAASAAMAADLAGCEPAPPRPPCRALRPGRWLIARGTGPVVLAERNGIAAEAAPAGYPPVGDAVLVLAVTALRPASAGEVAGLR